MKKLFLLTFVVAGLMACNNDYENDDVYSCNEQLNEWAHVNLRNIQAMDWESWQSLSEEYKLPAYNAMTPSQKILFWKDKVRAVLKLNWTEEEQQHITKLYNFFENNSDMYTPEVLKDPEKLKDLRGFLAQWEVDAMYDLRWTEKQVRGIIYTGNRLLNINGDYEVKQGMRLRTSGESGSGGSDQCNCYSEDANDTSCPGTCIMTDDDDTGCGSGKISPCNGRS